MLQFGAGLGACFPVEVGLNMNIARPLPKFTDEEVFLATGLGGVEWLVIYNDVILSVREILLTRRIPLLGGRGVLTNKIAMRVSSLSER